MAAIRVARGRPSFIASSARSTRPPSIGKAGMRLNIARNRLASARRARSDTLRVVEPLQVGGIERADDQQQRRRDDEIDRRPGDRDGEFLRRIVRQRLQAGDAADRQQRHLRRLNAVAARDEDVAELVQHDADKQQDDEDQAVARRRRARLAANR